MNLIGDIQGNYRTLLALLKQMPDDDPVSVGDMIDRGPRSMEVLEFFRNHGKALLGNHEHMMLDYFCDSGNYMPGLWLMNSGDATLNSLGLERSDSLPEILQDFLESLPLLLIRDGMINLEGIVESYVHLFRQSAGAWTFELDLRTSIEKW